MKSKKEATFDQVYLMKKWTFDLKLNDFMKFLTSFN